MHEQRKQFMQLLQSDEALMRMLASNNAFWNPALEPKNAYSVIPADKIYEGIKTPFITVSIGAENRVGDKLTDVFFYVRCYNESDKTYVTIDTVLSRVKVILDNHRFNQYADNAVSINTSYETTGAELTDQAYNLLFRESRYKVAYL